MKIRTGHSGIHMFNRTSGLNILLDEIVVPSTLWDRAPRHVSIALTNSCDLRCAHCFAPKNSDVLDFNQVRDWLVELDINGCLGVGFGGGEPTLYPRLVELCHFTIQHTRLAVTLTTHALNLDTRMLDELSGNVHFVRVSMDGVGATYESIRGYPFSIFLDCLNNVSSIAPLGINFIVNTNTLQDIDTAVKLASDVGAAEFLLLPEQPVRGFGGIDEITTESLRQWVSIYKGPVPLTVSEAGADGLPTCNPLPSETGLLAYAHIDASGSLKRSSFETHGVVIGKEGVMQALNVLSANREDLS